MIGNPALMRELTRVGMQSRTLMEWVLRIMANLLREDELGPAEAAYKAVAAIVKRLPDPRCRSATLSALGGSASVGLAADGVDLRGSLLAELLGLRPRPGGRCGAASRRGSRCRSRTWRCTPTARR